MTSSLSPRSGTGSTACRSLITAPWSITRIDSPSRPRPLGEPYSKHLRGGVRELRFHLGRSAWRLTYWLAPGQRIVLLTVFRKTRDRETTEVNRAIAAQHSCEVGHQAATHMYEK